MKKVKLKGFWVVDKWNDEGFPIVAETHREAKKLGYKVFCEDGVECEWIDLRVNLIKEKIDFSKYSKGQIEYSLENLKNGVYSEIGGAKRCPRCGELEPERVYYDKEGYNGFYCSFCEDFDKCLECGKFTREESEPKCDDCMNKEYDLNG